MAASVVYTTFAGQIVSENRGGVTREYLSDPLGSTIALASDSAITDTWDYWPYGEVMSRTGTNPTPFTFVGTLGYFKDLLDKLLYVRARFYQPNYGRWLTVDPLWPEEGAFSYAGCDPVRVNDRTGLGPNGPKPNLFSACLYMLCSGKFVYERYKQIRGLPGADLSEQLDGIVDAYKKRCKDPVEDCVQDALHKGSAFGLAIYLFCSGVKEKSLYACACGYGGDFVNCVACCNNSFKEHWVPGAPKCRDICRNWREYYDTKCVPRGGDE